MPSNTTNVSDSTFDTVLKHLKEAFKTSNAMTSKKTSLSEDICVPSHPKCPLDELISQKIHPEVFKRLFKSSKVGSFQKGSKTTYSRPYFLWDYLENLQSDYLILERFDDERQTIDESNQLIKKFHKTNLFGTLKQLPNGFCYLDISDEFLENLKPFLLKEHADIAAFPMGAHIPVLSCAETKEIKAYSLSEIGKSFSFSLKRFVKIKPYKGQYEAIFAIEVESLELSYLREKYRLSSKLCSHEFMITFGAQVRAEKKEEIPSGYFKVNPATLQA